MVWGVLAGQAQMRAPQEWKGYEQVLGVDNSRRQHEYDVAVIAASTSTNVLWPGEQPDYRLQIVNRSDVPLGDSAIVHVIRYGCRGIGGDVWLPEMYRIAEEPGLSLPVHVTAKGYLNVDIRPQIPATFGGYALVLEVRGHERRLITSLVRSFRQSARSMQFPKQSLDDIGPAFLERIGVHAIRMGVDYTPTDAQDYVAKMEELDRRLKEYQARHITVLLMFGSGNTPMPLGTPRSFLDTTGTTLNTKQDYAWLPKQDKDFSEFVHRLTSQYGWPCGPVTAVSLWNEPWEGISISGWQADMLRYREIYRSMADGVLAGRKEGVQVLVGGGDSNSNAWDKLFADGKMDFLPIFDFCSIHYQGMESPALYPEWINRKSPYGRVRIWDTESWVGNTDDRIGLVVATNRSAGYDRSMGIYGGYLQSNGDEEGDQRMQRVYTPEGIQEVRATPDSWSAAAAIGAVQELLGEREFKELLFRNGLPWVMVFDGYDHDEDDGTVVVSGDIGEAFGNDNVLFRGICSEQEARGRDSILKILNRTGGSYDSVVGAFNRRAPITGGKMIIRAEAGFRLYDFYGNAVAGVNGRLTVPLTYKGYFLRTDGSRGSMKRLITAMRTARIEGYEPVEIVAKDPMGRIVDHPFFDLELTNVLNRTVSGRLTVRLGHLRIEAASVLRIPPGTTLKVPVRIVGGQEVGDNTYSLQVRYDAGADGLAIHAEQMHVNLVSHRSIVVDGRLDDWKDVLPQPVKEAGVNAPSVTEAAWYPFKQFDTRVQGFANGYLAYDDSFFYFAAKVADHTPHPGTYRFATRPDDDFFYPDTSYKLDGVTSMIATGGVRQGAADDRSALKSPDTGRRLDSYLQSGATARGFGLDLRLPQAVISRVSFYLPPWDVWKADISIYDQQTGQLLAQRRVENLWHGVYESFDLSGSVRVVFRALDWWYTVKLGGFFVDSSRTMLTGSAGLGSDNAVAVFAREDLDTHGDWQGKYGSGGWWVPLGMENSAGAEARLPQGWSVDLPRVESREALVWPGGVRHFSYRKDPVLPDNSGLGYAYDNVLIAFNVLPIGQDGLLANPPGTMPRYTGYKCTDYEYALNAVAPQYGGGTEIWRLLMPGMNRKHFFPRQPRSPGEGAVNTGKLAIVQDGDTRITECAIPWSEIPDVRKALDAGQRIKFSFRVNDDGSPESCLELANGRSVSKKNSRAFHPDWKTHWANEVEFAFEK